MNQKRERPPANSCEFCERRPRIGIRDRCCSECEKQPTLEEIRDLRDLGPHRDGRDRAFALQDAGAPVLWRNGGYTSLVPVFVAELMEARYIHCIEAARIELCRRYMVDPSWRARCDAVYALGKDGGSHGYPRDVVNWANVRGLRMYSDLAGPTKGEEEP